MVSPVPDADLPLDVIDHREGAAKAEGPGPIRRLGLFRVPMIMLILFSGAVIGMYFQPPALRGFFGLTGLQPGAGSAAPIALPPEVDLSAEIMATLQQTDVIGLARLMPRGDISIVAPPFGSGGARVARILVAEGQQVEIGQDLAVLDNLRNLQSVVARAEAGVAVAEATYAQILQSVSNSVAEAGASLEQARAAAVAAESELERTQSLFERGIATRAALDQAVSAAQQAARSVERAEATLARYASGDPGEQPDVIVTARNLDAARTDLALARNDVSQAYVRSPIAGTVLQIDVHPGESPGQGGIMQVGDIGQMMAEVEVYQDRAAAIQVGQPVEILADSIGQTLLGEVERVGLVIGRQTVVSGDTAANTDARVIDVLVRLDAQSSERAARFTNLEVVARIDTRAQE